MSPSQAANELADKPLSTFARIGAMLDASMEKYAYAQKVATEATDMLNAATQELNAAQKSLDDFVKVMQKKAVYPTYWGKLPK